MGAVVFFAAALALGAAEPSDVGLEESVGVGLVQLEVTAWPKDPGSDACLGLTKDDLELRVGRKPREIYAVDAVALDEEVYKIEGPRPEDAPAPGGMSVVLLFDLWHLDLFYKRYNACPRTKPIAFHEARRYVQEQFHDGDRLLLVTFAGWPVIHEGWIRSREEAVRALERLEKNRQVLVTQRIHDGHNEWVAGLESLFLALGRYPGRKDVVYLADDFRFDDVAIRMFDIAARAQSNGVVVSAVDLLRTCRGVQGPPCMGTPEDYEGPGCTEFRFPVVLNPISRDTGGRLFATERIATAVQGLRSTKKCRYLVSFAMDSGGRKKDQAITLRLRGHRRDLTLDAPVAYQSPQRAPSRAESDQALFLLPRFGRGLAAEVAIWPYRAASKKKHWDVYVMARVEHADDEAWPVELREITVQAILRTRSTVHGSYRKTIPVEEMKAVRAPGGAKLLLFPFTDVPPGETTVDLTVTADVPEISANLRESLAVPDLPLAGEARPWFLSDHRVRLGDRAVMAPSFDDVITQGEQAGFLGFGCRSQTEGEGPVLGRLVPSTGGAPHPVPVSWLEAPEEGALDCGWLLGAVSSALAPGHWRFDPPRSFAGGREPSAVEFTVDGPDQSAASAQEVLPR